ncbi:hypothetical protein [Nocardia mikamii]|uniref:hypothetical protein n=1 Tax=Nocardia mikamii TaxID=508464 RepID=UPI0007A4EFBA|nr:hypothetical protein [Nocardia mikamii]
MWRRQAELEKLKVERGLTEEEMHEFRALELSGPMKRPKPGTVLSKSALQRVVVRGRKVPFAEVALKGLYDVAHGGGGSDEGWEELKRVNRALAGRLVAEPVTVRPSFGATRLPSESVTNSKPAESGTARALDNAPVPPLLGDRRNNRLDVAWPSTDEVVWRPVSQLVGYVSTGELENANSLMRHVGTEAEPLETADAIVACRDVDLPDAVDTIISHAGAREELLDVMQILKSLNERDRRADSDALLVHALQNRVS